MTIVYVLHETVESDGSTKAFANLLNGIIPLGIKPIVVLPNRRGICQTLRERGIEVFVSPYRHNTYPHHNTVSNILLFFPRLIARIVINNIAVTRLTLYLKKRDIDLIHTNVSVNAIGYKTAHNLKVPHVYHLREYADMIGLQYYPCKQAFTKQLHSEHSYAICITKDIKRHYGLDDCNNARVIYDGIKHQESITPEYSRGRYFLYVGRLEIVKGIEQLLHAYYAYYKQTSEQEVLPLYVVGGTTHPDYEKKLRAFVQENQLTDKVLFLGHRNDVEQLMGKATALIIPSLNEGFGFCMPEAMFNGCLTIALNRGGTKEQLDNGVEICGQEIALRYLSNNDLTKLLIQIASGNENDYEDYRKRAFLTVNTLYTIERHVKEVWQWYEDIIAYEKTLVTT